MMNLSLHLINRVRTTLLRSEHFDSQVSLRAIFVADELAYLRQGLPEGGTKKERVGVTINYLLGKTSSNGQSAMPVFLTAIRDLYSPGDELYAEFDLLRHDVESTLRNEETVEIPIVIGAMTQLEAAALFSEDVFYDTSVAPLDREKFQSFRSSLTADAFAGLALNYGNQRDEWRPHTSADNPIDATVSEIVDRINEGRHEIPGLPLIRLQYVSSEFFGDNNTESLFAWDALGKSGGIVIIDAISLFHPHLRQKLLQSAISSNSQVAVLILSPISAVTIPTNQLIEELIVSQMQMAFSRFHIHWDKLCEIGVGDLRAMQRWLFAILPDEARIVQNERPHPKNRQVFRDRMSKVPRGLDRAIFATSIRK